MKSMTGYAYEEFQNDELHLLAEVKSYNNRYLDISVNLPGVLSPFEPEIRNLVKKTVQRGHVDVNIRMRQLQTHAELRIDADAVRNYRQAFQQIAEIAEIEDSPRLTHFLQADDLIKTVKQQDAEVFRSHIMPLLEDVLVKFNQSRIDEGFGTRSNIIQQIQAFRDNLKSIQDRSDELEARIRQLLLDKFEELLGKEYDETRFLSEVAVLMVKYSINEELQRVESHLLQFERFMHEDGPVGKKIDFLCQELNREINTIASKSTLVEINQAVVLMKDHLENIREQLRNVE